MRGVVESGEPRGDKPMRKLRLVDDADGVRVGLPSMFMRKR
jgi:hypothetical protein